VTKKEPAIEIIGEDKCAGCFGCYNSCPEDAIEMKYDEYGFYLPFINENCNLCGICVNHCPVIQDIGNKKKFKEPIFYGGRSKDHEIRMMSSSGGIFSELAKYILDQSGSVFGAAWDENFNLEHIMIDDFDEIEKITGSKYVQSRIGESYKKVSKELDEGKKVLFAGTPCQIGALNTFSDHKNLLTVDLVCHGVPSYLLFAKYLKHLESKKESIVECISFRDKEKCWENYQIRIGFKDGTTYKKNRKLDPYIRGYLQDICLRKSCYDCKFQTTPRLGDITLGDFWGSPPEGLETSEGVSVILANTEKGDHFIKTLSKSNEIEIKKTNYDTATEGNPIIEGYKHEVPKERKQVLEDLRKKKFEYIQSKYINTPSVFKITLTKYVRKIKNFI